MRTRTKLVGILATVLILGGTVLKQLHLLGAGVVLGLGFIVFIAAFSPMFLIDKHSMETRKAAKTSYTIFFVTTIILMLGAITRILHFPGAEILGYLGIILFVIYIVFFSRPEEGRKLRIRKDRQLAAILFTDILGFTKMMGMDESSTLLALEQNRKIQKKWSRKYRGRWLKEMGDGSIIIFYTATEALLCGMSIQREIIEKGDFSIRMGIHISEIVFTDNDAFGDGMNVASRIADQASGKEIYFSDGVYQNVRNREDLNIQSIGITPLKNVDYDLKLYKVHIEK